MTEHATQFVVAATYQNEADRVVWSDRSIGLLQFHSAIYFLILLVVTYIIAIMVSKSFLRLLE